MFKLSSDIDFVVLTKDGTKSLVPLATAVFQAISQRSSPDIEVQFHKLSPLTTNVEACCGT